MTSNIIALSYLLILFFMGFKLLEKLTQDIFPNNDLVMLKGAWLKITAAAFLSIHFWMFSVISIIIILYTNAKLRNSSVLYALLLFAVPIAGLPILGFGIINYLVIFDFPMLLMLFLLIPTALEIHAKQKFRPNKPKLIWAETFFYLYVFLKLILSFRDLGLTGGFRAGFSYFETILLPVYVFSNLYDDKNKIKQVVYVLIMVAVLLSIVGAFESIKSWPIYNNLENTLAYYTKTFTLSREGYLRAMVTTQQPIVLGFIIAVGISIFISVRDNFSSSKYIKNLTFCVLIAGVISPFSKGTWLGVFVMILVHIMLGKRSIINIAKLIIGLSVVFTLFSQTQIGHKIIKILPFISGVQDGSYEYRNMLFKNSMIVVDRNPLFGSNNYLDEPEMLELLQGQGIIDITNSYLQILLQNGYAGLVLFVLMFLSALISLYRLIKKTKDIEMLAIIKGLLASIVGVLFMIGSVSSISFVPFIYWILLGLAISCIKLLNAPSKVLQ